MASFYQTWEDYTNVANALCGLGAFLFLFGGKDSIAAQGFVAVVAIASTVAATLKPSKKAKDHSKLAARFTDLSSAISAREATDGNVRWAKAQRAKIERDEPPVRRLVDLMARNEEYRSRGGLERDMIPLTWLQRTLGYGWTFGLGKVDAWKAVREENSPS